MAVEQCLLDHEHFAIKAQEKPSFFWVYIEQMVEERTERVRAGGGDVGLLSRFGYRHANFFPSFMIFYLV